MTDPSLVPPLLLTKVQRPRLSPVLVQRPRLLEQLQPPPGLILVIAPAGYGKTTLLSAWLDRGTLPCVWVSLDEQDNDLSVFVSYLITAVQAQFPTVGVETANLLNSLTPPPPAAIGRSLLGDLAAIDQEFILVLDDYHVIHENAVHQLLADLLRDLPAALHLVLAARIDPPLPWHDLRTRGDLLELRAADLRFTLDETASFLREAMRLQIDDQAVSVLTSRTEGWAAGLHLAALYFRHSGARTVIEANERGRNRYLINYLVAEVLAQLPLEVQDFILRTAILDELYGPLCEAVLGSARPLGYGQTQLEWLQRADLFLSPLGDAPQWYRYHHVFRQFLVYQLRAKFTPQEIAALHHRASAWFAAQGYLDEALQHALTASNLDAAVQIVVQHRHELMNQAEWPRLDRWAHLFPRQVIDEQPDLLLIEVWIKFIRQQLHEVPALLDRVEALLSRLPPGMARPLQGEVDSRRSALLFWEGDLALSLTMAQQALEKIPLSWWYIRGYTRLFLSADHVMSGDLSQAYAALYATGEPDQERGYQNLLDGVACFIHWMAVDLAGMAQAARRVVANSDQMDRSEIYGFSLYHLGLYHYQRNDLAAAEKYLMPLVMQPYTLHAMCFLNSAVLLARIRQAQGWPEEAREIAEVTLSFALETRSEVVLFAAQAFQAELALRQGRLAEASQWAEQYGSFRRVPMPFAFVPPVVQAEILLAQGTSASWQQARQLLAEMDDYFTSIHYTSVQIRVLALQAILHRLEGNEQQALAALEKSIALAEPGGFIRLYVDLGTPLKPLLVKLTQRGVSATYLAEILAAFDTEEAMPGAERHEAVASASTVRAPGLLTNREQQVLELFDRRDTDKEIAESLVISTKTVSSHIQHMGHKLGARGRRAIVAAAKEQGLLD